MVQIQNFKTHPSVVSALKNGKLRLSAWVYHFEKGSVSIYNSLQKKFMPSHELGSLVENNLGEISA